MKKENVSIQTESEKLRATRKYMEKKEVSLEQELADALQKLYEKYVPATVREYIDETAEDSICLAKPKMPKILEMKEASINKAD